MIAIRGNYYDGRTSAQVPAECRVYDNGVVRIHSLAENKALLSLSGFELSASPRVANTARHLCFPDGQKFETEDNRAVDDVLRRFRRRPWWHAVHLIESRKRYIFFCLAIVIACMGAVMRYGVPWSAEIIAHRLPRSVLHQAGKQTLDMLDRSFWAPSKLDGSLQERLRLHFQPLILGHPDLNLQVQFRAGGSLGANAFALPGGMLILTDEMVRLAETPDELLAVLAHEAGHVYHRHGVQRLIQDSLLGFGILAISGDASGSPHLFLGLPVVLTEMAYSREFERQADRYALTYLRSQGISPRNFYNLMRRLQQENPRQIPAAQERWSNYLSTHPSIEERLPLFDIAR